MRFRFLSLFLLTLLLLTPSFLTAQCTPPPTPGLRVCAPSNGAVTVAAAIDFRITPDFGAEIVKWTFQDNGGPLFESEGNIDTPVFYGALNGRHHVVMTGVDNLGKVYSGEVSYTLIGEHFVQYCQTPATPGINFCSPQDGVSLGTSFDVAMAAKGEAPIKNIRLYVDGKEHPVSIIEGRKVSILPFAGLKQGNHTFAFRVWDTDGNLYRADRVLRSSYTYRLNDCTTETPPDCNPGFDQGSLSPTGYVDNSFPVSATIVHNVKPIKKMRVYLDNNPVAESNGPVLTSSVENAPNGTHHLTFQGWDTDGIMYRVQYDININVVH